MSVLSGDERKLLSDVVVRAREVVEAACSQRIVALGVGLDKAPGSLAEEERALRVGLRARARQLGSVDALVTEAGFEHWHRMLFARFLADNGLLVDDQFGQPLTIGEVAEYAAETGETDKWEVAARFAARMLPGIFVQGDPVLAMRLPVEARQELESLLDRLPVTVMTSEDALGWVYQYWQAKRKDEVNRSERKIGGADLAPVTQLFTEDYMVRFLLENSLGAWWAARHPDSPLLDGWDYLRRDEDGSPAVGGFEGWPEQVANVTVMDPCCGSGHFLVAAFSMLWRMRVEDEGLEPSAAQDAVLRDNLFGLELDPRCTQIAVFALSLEAWKAGGYRELPLPNVACSGIPARAPLSKWLDLAGGDPQVEAALTRLHTLFANADTLGSLIDPVRAAEQAGLESVDWHAVAPLVQTALTAEARHQTHDPAAAVFGQAAAGIARAADYLSQRYTLVCTNPPFLVRHNQDEALRGFSDAYYPSASRDLATTLLERVRETGQTCAYVAPTNWMFLASFEGLRRHWLTSTTWLIQARLGKRAFRAIGGEVVQVVLSVVNSTLNHGGHQFLALDAEDCLDVDTKMAVLQERQLVAVDQLSLLSKPAATISYVPISSMAMLSRYADVHAGAQSGDDARYRRAFWEIAETTDWEGWMTSVPSTLEYGGRTFFVRWESGANALIDETGAVLRGRGAWGRQGVLVTRSGSQPVTLYTGDRFSDSVAAVIPKREEDVPAVFAFCSDPSYSELVRQLNRKVIVANNVLTQVPIDIDLWRELASRRWPQGLPEPQSFDPTQWLFRGVVEGSRHALQVAVARLLGFRWPDQDSDSLDALADTDGVVCLPALGGESTAEERLRELLATTFGSSWSAQVLDGLLVEAGGKPGGLGKWLRDSFFKDHCKVFANRPFIWQIWDGRPDGFSALVNYHKLDRKLLERLTYDYLGSWWVGRLNDEVAQQVPGAEGLLVAAEELKAKLQLILEGEPPYDIYVRWKSVAEQPLGWDPDLDDGVRLNIRPFMTAGVLRAKPNIKWEKDRGKNPDGSERLNDLHYTLAEKRAARGGSGQ